MSYSYYDVDDDNWKEVAISEGRRAAWLCDCLCVRYDEAGKKLHNYDEAKRDLVQSAEQALTVFMDYHRYSDEELAIGVNILKEAFQRYRVHDC